MNESLLDLSPFSAPSIPRLFPPSNCHLSLAPFLSPSPSLSVRIPLYLSEQGEPDRCRAEGRQAGRKKQGRENKKKVGGTNRKRAPTGKRCVIGEKT